MNKYALVIILSTCLRLSECFLDYSAQHTLSCQTVPGHTPLSEVLPLMWNVSILHQIDRYTFLIVCPVMFIAQMIIVFAFYKFPSLFVKPGDIFFGILVSEILLNLHLFVTAIYQTINSVYQPMPDSFIAFCTSMSIVQSLLFIVQVCYLFFFLLWAIFTVKTSLKQKSFLIGISMHLMILGIAVVVTIFFWFDQFLGLSTQGLCAITSVRKKQAAIALPVVSIIISIVFTALGIYSWAYFKKNMPRVEGLQRRRYFQNRLIFAYVAGFSIFLILYNVIGLVMYINCSLDRPVPLLTLCASIQSYLILIEYLFFIILLLQNPLIRKKVKKSLRGICQKESDWAGFQFQKSRPFQQTDNLQFGLDQKVLQLKDQQQTIDMMQAAQVISIIAGIYVSHVQYLQKFDPKQEELSNLKKIYYNQSINFQLGPQIFRDYKIETQILPKVGILGGTMTIHCPRIFKRLINSDKLFNIEKSFDLFKNYQKIYNLVQGQGGKSGQFFFFSSDNKYVLKTINSQQFQFIIENLQTFAQYYQSNPYSLLAKIYGVYSLNGHQLYHTYHLILMKNILGCKKSQIIRTYDMKGSKHDRQVIKADKKYKYNELNKITLKDTDFVKLQGKLNISESMKAQFRNILRKDSEFLKSMSLIDYSLLVVRINWKQKQKSMQRGRQMSESKQMAQQIVELQDIPSSAPNVQRKREPSNLSGTEFQNGSLNYSGFHKFQQIQSTEDPDQYYHIGVIDYMQKWDLQKKGQRWWKTLIGKKQVSAEEPNKYQSRFISFVDQITYVYPLSDSVSSKNNSILSLSALQMSKIRISKTEIIKQKPLQNIKEIEQENRVHSISPS